VLSVLPMRRACSKICCDREGWFKFKFMLLPLASVRIPDRAACRDCKLTRARAGAVIFFVIYCCILLCDCPISCRAVLLPWTNALRARCYVRPSLFLLPVHRKLHHWVCCSVARYTAVPSSPRSKTCWAVRVQLCVSFTCVTCCPVSSSCLTRPRFRSQVLTIRQAHI